MGINIYGMAKEAGVSTATISRVVNGTGNVRPETRKKVLKVLNEYNYTVNDIARSLAKNSTKSIALLAKDIRDDYYAHIAHSVQTKLETLGYFSFLYNSGSTAEQQIQAIRTMLSKRVNALVILSSPSDNEELHKAIVLAARNVPVILANGVINGENIYSILRDDASVTKQAVNHLIEQGCTKLIFVSDYFYSSDFIKKDTFTELIAQYAGQVASSVHSCSHNFLDAQNARRFMVSITPELEPGCTGILASNDYIALGLMRELLQLGFKIPQDIKLAGYDNAVFSTMAVPSLTTVDNNIEQHCDILSDILEKIFRFGEPAAKSHILVPTLVIRDSSLR